MAMALHVGLGHKKPRSSHRSKPHANAEEKRALLAS
uniref:Uncharacterized protein n=1 Tax=Physcomitrium patens TaxID=3218 RepID=A0A2K1LAH0_PHYPA|nr:hypothetical protein PHYPA_001443 [Physcomitrium patens]